MSLQRRGRWVHDSQRAERLAVRVLRGVGGDTEWWIGAGTANEAVAHLRVPVTVAENDLIPYGIASFDAGETGPQRPRTR